MRSKFFYGRINKNPRISFHADKDFRPHYSGCTHSYSVNFICCPKSFYRHTRERHLDIAKGVAVIAQKIIDADSVERYKAEGRTASGYEETLSRLNNLQKKVPDI